MSFDVDANELRQYAGKLDAQHGTAGEIAGLVSKADVSDKSWGVVGLFVKQKYTGMLGDLNDLFTDLQEGLRSGAEKFRGAADGYQGQDDAVKNLLKGLQLEIEGH